MSHEFSENIDAFDLWKSDIGRTLSRFRLWLRRNELFNEDIDSRLFKLQESLKSEYLTLAFVGEFSRGKTELINSLFFADYGQRILPSEAGRTTMCPTELFYDRKEARPYLRLLPIETRLESTTLSEYRDMPSQWTEVPLMTGSAQEMTYALHTITQTKEVSLEEAKNLGFTDDILEKLMGEDNKVEIPAWRHALVSFPHDLLKRGLCILDTPGLNALGSEPELTLKLLPQAQAIVFLLGADTGVTASDMAIWENYIQNLERDNSLGTFAVLNKIDTLWDELSSRKKVDKAVTRMINTTARQLQIETKQVLPVSAQKALVAKVRNDKSMLIRSQITELEHLLSVSLLENKEHIIWESVIKDAKSLVEEATQLLTNKSDQLYVQKGELQSLTGDNKQRITQLVSENERDLKEFEHRLIAIKPSQRLLERQTQILLSVIGARVLSKEVEVTLNELVNSKTTIGLFRHMRQFFIAVKTIMKELTREAELTNKMAVSLYDKFTNDFGMQLLEPKLFPAKRLGRDLEQIIKNSERLNNSIFTTFTEHSLAVKRFFSGTVTDVMSFFKSTRQELISWTQNVIHPLTQQLRMQQKLITDHRNELAELTKSRANLDGKIKGLSRLIDEIEMERQTATELIDSFEAKKPGKEKSNIVRISSAGR
ncbi:dynamin family protein [Aliikangiella coralliicola]|uniref:GTPase n=1 Tax=Aliikangiella coralliicola TaxID=2592383 RepID=A0A545U7A8_9GAMM|nr:dynamin family protein [Aliikangiella coralliicola]TQV85358.1 GTPase [Aliikangiella coralliicola]